MGLKKHVGIGLILLALMSGFGIVQAREVSKSGQIYNEVKDGIVTVITASHGSGFLVDESGLILTNSHVVNEAGESLKVRFGPGQVVKAVVVENDRLTDVAIIRVNLKNISNAKVLTLFTPPEDEPLVLTGEKVIAIGSPIEWETLEKTVTEGIVSKFDGDVIRHDASLNGGNSGGPLLNFDGQVVGINTFGESERGPAIGGTIPISKVLPVLEKAKQKLETAPPNDELLADIPRQPYPAEVLAKLSLDSKFKSNQKLYFLRGLYYDVRLSTPALSFRELQQQEKETIKYRKKRLEKNGLHISDDERQSLNLNKYYSYNKPVVTVWVSPKPFQTFGSAFAQGLVAGLAGYPAAASIPAKFVFKKDFMSLILADKETEQPVCEPYLTGRVPHTVDFAEWMGYGAIIMQDKTYIGKYEFDPKCFDTTKNLVFKVQSEGEEKEKAYSISEKLKAALMNDFKPYWAYYAPQAPVLTQNETTSTEDMAVLREIIRKNSSSTIPVDTPGSQTSSESK